MSIVVAVLKNGNNIRQFGPQDHLNPNLPIVHRINRLFYIYLLGERGIKKRGS